MRSSWRVVLVRQELAPVEIGDQIWNGASTLQAYKIEADGTVLAGFTTTSTYDSDTTKLRGAQIFTAARWREFTGSKGAPTLRAEALTPGPTGGNDVIGVFEAETPGALMLQIGRSGLLSETSAALWLGGEIERVWSTR